MIVRQDSTQRILLLMDHSLDFVELLGAEGRIKGVSTAITSLAGYLPDELTGRHFQDLLHPDDRARATELFASLVHGAHPDPIQLRYRRKDGEWRTIQASARNFLDDPRVKAIIVLTRDLTDELYAKQSLVQSNTELRRLTRELIDAGENERRHIARELHDDVQQILVGLRFSMDAARRNAQPTSLDDLIDPWIVHVQDAIGRLHNLTIKLRTQPSSEPGLRLKICLYIEDLKLAAGQDLRLELGDGLGSIHPNVDFACFRIVQEALSNAIRHSGARHLKVALQRTGHFLTVSISDDGAGFDLTAAQAVAHEHFGLLGMRERAALAGGHLKIKSSVGQGTRVSASFVRRPE